MNNKGFENVYEGTDATKKGEDPKKEYLHESRSNQKALESKREEYIIDAINKVKQELEQIENDKVEINEPGEHPLLRTIKIVERTAAKIKGEKDETSPSMKLLQAVSVVRRQLEIDHGLKDSYEDNGKATAVKKELDSTYGDDQIEEKLAEWSFSTPKIKAEAQKIVKYRADRKGKVYDEKDRVWR